MPEFDLPTLSPEAEDDLIADFFKQGPNLVPLARARGLNLDQLIEILRQPRIRRKLRELERLACVKLRACRIGAQLTALSRLSDLAECSLEEETSRKAADAILRSETRRQLRARTRAPRSRPTPRRPKTPTPKPDPASPPPAPTPAQGAHSPDKPRPLIPPQTPVHSPTPTPRAKRAQTLCALAGTAQSARPPPPFTPRAADTIPRIA